MMVYNNLIQLNTSLKHTKNFMIKHKIKTNLKMINQKKKKIKKITHRINDFIFLIFLHNFTLL